MKIAVMPLDTQTFTEYKCDSFEFRANKVTNWVRIKKDGKEVAFIERVAVFKNEDVLDKIRADIDSIDPNYYKSQPKTGHWSHDGSHWENRFICSECGYKLFDEPTNYCPNCGAKMDDFIPARDLKSMEEKNG